MTLLLLENWFVECQSIILLRCFEYQDVCTCKKVKQDVVVKTVTYLVTCLVSSVYNESNEAVRGK